MQSELSTHLSDGELLTRYITSAEQEAFAELVERYQPMVLRVCRQVLGTSPEADDASQQVFTALSMKAMDLQDRDSLASWLYRVAWNISSKTRRAIKIRESHEAAAWTKLPHHQTVQQTEPDTLLILHEALAEIPDINRQAIVLHYFCGYTTAEAAARLRCPAGTVAARVSRGLQQLRAQLSDRDLILTAVAIKLVLLGIMGSSKAAAATGPTAAVIKGRLPRYFPPYRPMVSRLLVRSSAALALLPTGLAFSAARACTPAGSVSGFTWGIPPWQAVFNWASKYFGKLLTTSAKKPAVACALAAAICAGAGTAAQVIVASLPPTVQKTASSSTIPDETKPPKDAETPKKAEAPEAPRPSALGSGVSTAVPEPASLSVVACAGLMLLGRRRPRSS